MAIDLKAAPFTRRLAEARAWCSGRLAVGPHGDSLWTPTLRPPGIGKRPRYSVIRAAYAMPYADRGPDINERETLASHPVEKRSAIVDALVGLRAERLRTTTNWDQGQVPGLGGGGLVLFDPDTSLSDGAAEDGSDGFFDSDNMPAWDTWICYVTRPEHRTGWMTRRPERYLKFTTYLIAWVPPELLRLVDDGIGYNPEECIAWAQHVDTGFARELRASGLLRPPGLL